ncbi:MAG: adenylyl-sulfate kinase [Proteobacteria bacterium]|nr:adenylyl-sulfate kinase [Pseudomonadota bacterium]
MNKNNITWHNVLVSGEEREKLHGHKGAVVWFTGLSASGKSTVAHIVEKELFSRGCSTYVFDGDNVRHGLCSDLAFSAADRTENIRRIGEMVKLFVDAGIIVLAAFISPFRKDRDRIRSLFKEGIFFEVYMNCPAEICSKRDKKGIYEKAKAGIIKEFTGISSPYEPPLSPELVIDSAETGADEAAGKVKLLLEQGKII